MRWIGKGRYGIPSHAVGIAERACGWPIDYAEHPGDVRPPIGANQAIQWMIADSETELEAGALAGAARRVDVDQGRTRGIAVDGQAVLRRDGQPMSSTG